MTVDEAYATLQTTGIIFLLNFWLLQHFSINNPHAFCVQAHSDVVNYICWDTNGELLASVSQDSVKVWSLTSGECIHELCANGNQYHSCVFHPSFSSLLVVGGTRVTPIP